MAAQLERKLRGRPERQWLQNRSILRDAGALMQCQMTAGDRPCWDWRKTCDVRDVWKISSGFGVELLLTSNEQLIRSGDFQQVEYEQVCLRKRKQKLSRAHGSLQNFKLLPQRDASMILEANDRTSCVPIGLPTGHRVRQIACGLSHCAVITESESSMLSLFTMGHGLYGQLGLGETVHAPSLTPVTSSSELLLEMLAIGSHDGVTLRCGPFATSLLIRDTSSVWLWGLLPCADSPTKLSVQDTPTLFPWINPGVRVADVAMGMEHLTLLSTSGSVFTWGIGCSGQLGLELTARENAHQNAARVQFYDANVVVESISSGWYHTMAVATDGRVFAWGCNRYGACGATTKFLEYFHPVLLTLPSNLIQDPSSKWSVHCWGHTSSLLVKHRSGAIERTLVWGICSSKHASLLPVDAGGSASGHQDFVHAQAGFGCIHWIVQQRQQVSKVPIPLFQLIADHSSPIVNGDRTFYCDSDETVTLPLTMVPGFEANDAAVHDAVIISLRAVSRHRRLSQAASLNAQCRLCENTSQGAGLVIKMDPMEEGEYCIQVAINGLFVLGFPVCLKVSAKSSNIVDNIGHDQCEILGISVTSQSASEEESSLANLRWFGTKFHRVRVTTQDELVILARVSTNCSLDLKCHGNDNHSRTIPLIALTSDSCGTQFALAVVTFPIPASFAVGIVSSDPPNDPRNVLYVDCCAAERELKSVVSAHKRLVGRYLASVSTMESPVYAKFALFMSSILNHGTLRLVTARSPWIDVDSEPLFDFDRFAFEQQILKASKDPFILWKSILDSDLDTDIVHEKAVREGRTLDELMPTWSTEIRHACYAPLKALVNGGVQKSIALPDTRDASEHQTTSRRVHQSPYEFLIRTSSTMSIGQNGDQCDDAICSWLDHNGDVHYTPKRHDGQYLIAVYLNDNGGALVEGNPVALWKRQLHAVLWPLIDTHDTSMTGLFRFLAACNGDTESTITYQSFVRRTQALGFGRSMAKQQWYALFVNIQAMSLTERPTIPLHVFRSFLVDPFHEIFWKQYLHNIKSRSASLEASTQLVLQHLGPWIAASDERARCIPWRDLVTRLDAFNVALVTRCSSSSGAKRSMGVSDYCRLLYRFDVHCNGFIPVNLVIETTLSDLKLMFEETQNAPVKARLSKCKSAVTSKWRPDVDAFTTTDGVRKLFTARAKKQQQERVLCGSKSDAVLELMSSGNTRLAHIRSLPVSRMLREGTYFRPQQAYAGAMIAEHSF